MKGATGKPGGNSDGSGKRMRKSLQEEEEEEEKEEEEEEDMGKREERV